MDSYLNGISACWEFYFDNFRAIKKFSELSLDATDPFEERIYATLDYETGKLCLEDVKGEELKKYIVNDYILVFKIQGIKEDEKETYALWKQDELQSIKLRNRMSKSIYLLVKCTKSSFEYLAKSRLYIYGISAENWHHTSNRSPVIKNIDFKYILRQFKVLIEDIEIKIGMLHLVSIDNDRFIQYRDDIAIDIKLYWHNIALNSGLIVPMIKISGAKSVNCVINITSKDIFPNVARDRIMDNEKHMITLALEKAALQYIVNNMPEDKKLQEALQAYINKNYPEDNPYYAKDKM